MAIAINACLTSFLQLAILSIKDAGVMEVSDMVVPADTDVNQCLTIFQQGC